MKKMILLLLFLLMASSSSHVLSFTLNNNIEAVFYSRTVQVNVADTSCEHLGYTHDELLTLIEESMDQYWNRVGASRLRLRKGRIITNTPASYKTGSLCTSASYQGDTPCQSNPTFIHEENAILFVCNQNTLDFPAQSGVLAATLPYIQGRHIKNSVILLNDTLASQGNGVRQLSKQELLSLLAHEVGHAIGLGHSEVKSSLMYYSVISQREDLGRDDWDAVSYLYPQKDSILGLGVGRCGGITSFINDRQAASAENTSRPFTYYLLSLLTGMLSYLALSHFQKYLKNS
jgi:hypothetical protein